MLEINFIQFEGLTEDEQRVQPDNGYGKEYANYTRLTYDGETVAIYSDAMESEDCTRMRNLQWAKIAIMDAYKLGKESK